MTCLISCIAVRSNKSLKRCDYFYYCARLKKKKISVSVLVQNSLWFHVFASFRLQVPFFLITGFLYILFKTTLGFEFLQRRSWGISIPHFSQIQPTISGVFGHINWEEEQQFNNMHGTPLMQKNKIPQKQPVLKLQSFI